MWVVVAKGKETEARTLYKANFLLFVECIMVLQPLYHLLLLLSVVMYEIFCELKICL